MTEQDTTDELGDDQYREEAAAERAESEGDTKNKAEEETDETTTTDDQGDEGEESGDEQDEEGGKPFDDTDTPEIPTRNASHIIARQRKTIEKQREKLRSTSEEEETLDDETGDEEGDGETNVSREVARQLKPITDRLVAESDERELQELFVKEPDAKSYEKTIRAFMKHDAWAQVPPNAIYAYLSREHALAQGARQKDLADREAAETRGAGSQRRSTPKKKGATNFPSATEIESMSDEEIEKLAQQVETGQFQE